MPLPLLLLAALSALGQGAAAVGSAVGQAAGAVGSAAGAVGPALGQAASSIGPALGHIGPAIAQGAESAVNAVAPIAKGVVSGSPLKAIQGGAQTLGEIGVPGAEQVGNALGKVTSSPFKLANVTEAGAPASVSPVAPAPATPGAMPEFVRAGNLPESAPATQGPPQPNMMQQIQDFMDRFGGQKKQEEDNKDPNDLSRYGYDAPTLTNPVSKAVVSGLKQIPGVDILGNIGKRLSNAYLGDPKMQAAKLRVLDETGQAKAQASQSGDMLDFLTRIAVQSQSDQAALDRTNIEVQSEGEIAAGVQQGETGRADTEAKRKTDSDNLLLATNILNDWDNKTEQQKFGFAAFLKSVFSDVPISESEMNGLTWSEETGRKVKEWWKQKFGGGSGTVGPTSAPGTPAPTENTPRKPGRQGIEQQSLDDIFKGL